MKENSTKKTWLLEFEFPDKLKYSEEISQTIYKDREAIYIVGYFI